MRKAIIAITVVAVASSLAYMLVTRTLTKKSEAVEQCPTDVMMCPDGTSVARSGSSCEFGICKQALPEYLIQEDAPQKTSSPTTSMVIKEEVPLPRPQTTTNLFKKITQSISYSAASLFKKTESTVSTGVQETASVVSSEKSTPSQAVEEQAKMEFAKGTSLDETRYVATNGIITTTDGTVIYTASSSSSGGSTPGWTTTIVDAVPVNQIAPIVGAIPVTGLPGKFYLSENSFGNLENCEFSNKIYILDTTTNQRTLMFEENNTTLSRDDMRSCNSEIFLLATEGENLILKYHTIGTNMICDSAWSEPEKTWFLNVTEPEKGMLRYRISAQSYSQAEQDEAACRLQFETSTSSEQAPAVNG